MGDKAVKIEQLEEHDYAKKPHQEQPPMKVTKYIKGGQSRDYYLLESVNSVEELDNFRFKNQCVIENRKVLPTFASLIMRCTKKRQFKPGKQCSFELLALRQESGTIHVYAHGEHNHPIMPQERRASNRPGNELMPASNPPWIYWTPDNTEWKFVQTFSDYDHVQEFRRKSQCIFRTGREHNRRFRLPCCRKKSKSKCEFQMLALKTTNAGSTYHVYTFGEHNHPQIKPRKKQQPAACDHQQKEQGMEFDEEEAGEDDDQQENEEGDGRYEPIEEGGLENVANPRVETLDEMLQKAIAKVYKWMAGIEPSQIGQTLEGWDNAALVQMADQEIRQHPEKFHLWRPWLKVAIKKCIHIEGFGAQYNDLISLMLDHVQD